MEDFLVDLQIELTLQPQLRLQVLGNEVMEKIFL